MTQLMWLVHVSLIIMLLGSVHAMAIEEAAYKVVKSDSSFEVRDYESYIVAETLVDGEFEDAGGKAFKRLFRYISGDNRSQSKVAMTAPVSQASGEKIEMTAPVSQEKMADQWVVSFMMPASYTMESLPVPEDSRVTLRQVAAKRMATVRYSGFWSEKNFKKNKLALEDWIQKEQLTVIGTPIWARYNAPFVPWFLRRNEILIPIAR